MSELVSLIDAPATTLAATGIPVPESYHGRALQPLVAGEAQDWPKEVFAQIS
ncbi:MAG TPA: arylsulfatase, partial [Armatimonadetes bacterium]|nr:arylsulfatase [Armatimonadota bacterium]